MNGFTFLPAKSSWSIPETQSLYCVLHFSVDPVAFPPELLSEYNELKEVSFAFANHYVYTPQGPVGKFTIEGSKCHTTHEYLRMEGFDYRMEFLGEIIFSPDGMRLAGRMQRKYEGKLDVDLDLFAPLDPGGLDWSLYQFRTMAEVEAAPPEIVRDVWLETIDFTELPPSLLRCTEMTDLAISHRAYNTRNTLATISENIGALSKLEKIRFHGCPIRALPRVLGKLERLERIAVADCLLEDIPLEIWQSKSINDLFLERNKITSVPEAIDLPELTSLSVYGNQLTTLPKTLAVQAKLTFLKLSGNPWTDLPANIDTIEKLELEVELKAKFFGYDYAGADGKGTVAWNEEKYLAESDPKLMMEVAPYLSPPSVQAYAPAFRALLKKGIGYKQGEEETYQMKGNTRFGGMPDLPPGMDYPRFISPAYNDEKERVCAYEFIAQLNLDELAPVQDFLPRTGTLYFFLSTLHDIGLAAQTYPLGLVRYHNGPKSGLGTGADTQIPEEEFYEAFDGGYTGYTATAFPVASLPSLYSIRQNDYLFTGRAAPLSDVSNDTWNQLYDNLEAPLNDHFAATHGTNVYGFSQHEYPEKEAAMALRGKPNEWTVLLKVASAGDFQWGDAGDLFFVAHKSDLERGDFSNIHVGMYSS